MKTYLILKVNIDPYCGGDYEFIESENKENLFNLLSKNFDYNRILHIYDITDCNDLIDIFS